ncbi:hypothetical protein KK062_21105 [Fulvivirgaceae bacterium PWU5]|uniref:Uncharacterized protein n=1 Tax=Dawidia cretensis TaxID=2782350 RepID=A0AAP2E0C2_9BACT|nr:hypothetical protein [Dawidia cretensis]MBT1710753.1 hypothetical protein [Dawidia cretensis]
MIIKHTLIPSEGLFLRAYSFDDKEFIPLENVFARSIGALIGRLIGPDRDGRKGLEYEIKFRFIKDFERYVGLRFFVDRIEMVDEGIVFRCNELSMRGRESGCRTFRALDLDRAKVKCATVIAREESWFSGDAQEGPCYG